LRKEDECYYLREYTPHAGYDFSTTNNLIQNLKKPVARRGLAEYQYKEQAIDRAGRELKSAINLNFLRSVTLVPMPPSCAKDDVDYDDRMLRIINVMVQGVSADVRELIFQTLSHPPYHGGAPRNPVALAHYYAIDEALADPEPITLAVFDDILTTGAHFRAAKRILLERFPSADVIGFFLARCVPWPSDI